MLRGHTSYVYPVAFSPDGRWLASGSWDNTARLWDAATGEPCATLPHDQRCGVPGLRPRRHLAGDKMQPGPYLRVWDVATARVLKKIPCGGSHNPSLTLSPDGTRVADWRLRMGFEHLAHACARHRVRSSRSSRAKAQPLAYSPDGRWLAAAAADAKDGAAPGCANTRRPSLNSAVTRTRIFKAAFSPDSRCSRHVQPGSHRPPVADRQRHVPCAERTHRCCLCRRLPS